MANYYFHPLGQIDEVGTELPTVQAAIEHAQQIFARMVEHSHPSQWRDEGLRLSVTDASGAVLFALDAVFVQGRIPAQ